MDGLRVLVFALFGCASPTRPPAAGGHKKTDPTGWVCTPGEERCYGNLHQTCGEPDPEDCAAAGLRCVPPTGDGGWCVLCVAGELRCDGNDVQRCSDDASGWEAVQTCDPASGLVCHAGACAGACDVARAERSNEGCEYYAVDLDNVSLDSHEDAAGQQYAVAVGNPFDAPITVD